jgi:hypothetical protein
LKKPWSRALPAGRRWGGIRFSGLCHAEWASSAFRRGGPFGGERFADQRLDEFGDGAGVGVVGAERGAGGGVEAAFEEGAEDGGVDGAPVHVGGGAVQGGEVGGGEGGTSMV